MINSSNLIEITPKKGEKIDCRCEKCGKKLYELEKNQGNSPKNAVFFLKIKCCRCNLINNFCIK